MVAEETAAPADAHVPPRQVLRVQLAEEEIVQEKSNRRRLQIYQKKAAVMLSSTSRDDVGLPAQ